LALKKIIGKIMSDHTGKSEEQIHKDSERDFFMNPIQARDYGIIDKVIEPGKPL
jgi:ATP-dependent Clp protease protease subunit